MVVPESKKASKNSRLSRKDWIEAALNAIAEGGIAAVAVEPLAARLRTTKGSFYWHFANRDALLQAALAQWEEQTTTVVINEIQAADGEPIDRLRRLITRVVGLAERDAVGPALIANARHPAVKPVLTRVTEARIGLAVEVLRGLGFEPAEALRRAMLAYSAYLGHAQLAHSTPELMEENGGAYLEHVLQALGRR
jgi:AcrR family transcriptional regulator